MPLDFAWLGHGLAIDLANTFVPHQDADLLHAWPERERWPKVGENELADLRQAVTALLAAAADRHRLPAQELARINQASVADPERVSLGTRGLVRKSGIRGAVARTAMELLVGDDADRLARCHAPGCGMFFLARRPQQVWCCASCGNRARVARHYARRLASGSR